MPGHGRYRPKCQAIIRIAACVKGLVKVSGEYGAIRTGLDGSMNHGARGVPGARGETVGGLAAGDLTGRVIGLAIKVHKTVGPGSVRISVCEA